MASNGGRQYAQLPYVENSSWSAKDMSENLTMGDDENLLMQSLITEVSSINLKKTCQPGQEVSAAVSSSLSENGLIGGEMEPAHLSLQTGNFQPFTPHSIPNDVGRFQPPEQYFTKPFYTYTQQETMPDELSQVILGFERSSVEYEQNAIGLNGRALHNLTEVSTQSRRARQENTMNDAGANLSASVNPVEFNRQTDVSNGYAPPDYDDSFNVRSLPQSSSYGNYQDVAYENAVYEYVAKFEQFISLAAQFITMKNSVVQDIYSVTLVHQKLEHLAPLLCTLTSTLEDLRQSDMELTKFVSTPGDSDRLYYMERIMSRIKTLVSHIVFYLQENISLLVALENMMESLNIVANTFSELLNLHRSVCDF